MSENLLALSVGNTRTQLGLFHEGVLEEHHHIASDQSAEIVALAKKLYAVISGSENPAVYLASVNDPIADPLADKIAAALGEPVKRMDVDVTIPIGRQTDREALTGEDRLLNAAAAYDRLKSACIVIDAGTAMTVDFIDGIGTFHGGAILPGAAMMLRSLNDHTAALPLVKLAAPEDPVGHNTEEAIRSGVFYALRGAARELVEKYAEVYQGYPRVIATGGDAQLLFEGYDLVEAIVPELTMQGIAVAHRQQIEADD